MPLQYASITVRPQASAQYEYFNKIVRRHHVVKEDSASHLTFLSPSRSTIRITPRWLLSATDVLIMPTYTSSQAVLPRVDCVPLECGLWLYPVSRIHPGRPQRQQSLPKRMLPSLYAPYLR
ncbi:hypothetical protein L202_00205 [Cryptococcus amylolentus CBS 6039]|uniref:Uncharacterized protein n=1 Tax=Cryptococcus amylolentus CBS 6039 TaxID=1295533 RepID=A0A1E3I8N7_9TREE|nr:hypothetical protein L202_00205 [Cryptococcus amylolentus CBS 6039]ODN84206.1 hypothetical protein L202_00205 [Cryptococcus amylolentus CBS 6039]